MNPSIQRLADLRGIAHLTTDAVVGVTSVVEAMHAGIARLPHRAVWGNAAAAPKRTRGITGMVYRSVEGVTRLVGGSVDTLLGLIGPRLTQTRHDGPPGQVREALVSALNGVVGDHLAATANPLAISMGFRHAGRRLVVEQRSLNASLPDARPSLLVLIHGLCMNDLQWHRDDHDHGKALAHDLGFTSVYLHYNSGLSIATNGRLLAAQLERLVDAWPVPLERLVLLGHSMGGLLARSALHEGPLLGRRGLRWPSLVSDLVCLGSPHQGAPLERAGHGIDRLLGAAPYAAPLARLGMVRSAGINDLRLGNIASPPADAPGMNRRMHVALPEAVRCFAIAGSLGPSRDQLKARLMGDGLVPVDSALGDHPEPARRLAFHPQRRAVLNQTGHLDLLSSAEVYVLLRRWLA